MSKQWCIQRGTNTWTEDEGLGDQDFYDSVREYEFKNSVHVIEYSAIEEKNLEIEKLKKTFSEVNEIFERRQTILRNALERILQFRGHADIHQIAKQALEDSV